MKKILFVTALALTSAASFAAEGDVKIRCTNDSFTQVSIEFRETNVAGQYDVVQVQNDGNEVPALDIETQAAATMTEAEIAASAKSAEGTVLGLDYYWGNPNVLRIKGLDNVTLENLDVCTPNFFEMNCKRL